MVPIVDDELGFDTPAFEGKGNRQFDYVVWISGWWFGFVRLGVYQPLTKRRPGASDGEHPVRRGVAVDASLNVDYRLVAYVDVVLANSAIWNMTVIVGNLGTGLEQLLPKRDQRPRL